MTRLYCAWSVETEPHAWPRSVPAAPPKETRTSPPAARRLLIAVCQPLLSMEVSPFQVALQPPPPMTKASV